MIDGYLFPLTVITAVGCGVIAGVLYAGAAAVAATALLAVALHVT